MILPYCADPEHMNAILGLLVGLEISAYFGNAQRLALRDALKLAFPGKEVFNYRASYSKETVTSIVKWLTYLKSI